MIIEERTFFFSQSFPRIVGGVRHLGNPKSLAILTDFSPFQTFQIYKLSQQLIVEFTIHPLVCRIFFEKHQNIRLIRIKLIKLNNSCVCCQNFKAKYFPAILATFS